MISPKTPSPPPLSPNPLHPKTYLHTSSPLTLSWLIFSIPLIVWDLGFVVLRPMSMPGGSLHSPIWAPYAKYVRTDYIYGWKAWEEKNGFTAAQACMNVPETVLYCVYLYLVYTRGMRPAATQERSGSGSRLGIFGRRCVAGRPAALAITAGFMGAVMTCSKTVLYGLNEIFSGCRNVGHNDWSDLILFYMIPNGAWLVASALMTYAFGREILQGLSRDVGVPALDDK
ncbi:hypothetical protein P154DRAFT_451973 [Amniculicola lignicola CBS 123094]|uniref:EXPERA domain-containing protein n=1 Tax=Amniculicola lignicola CBS 123094 TaxID=1392246 RepID=A0A6A5VY49_9PLEO|nr:hypothetical protein P154DRAFT_451973 [Amniculicola lignicola CBS 123094]